MDTEELKKTAELAMLKTDDAELEAFAREVEKVLEYMNTMDEAEVDGIEPTTHAFTELMTLRTDQTNESETQRENLLAQAPDRDGDHIRIPNVLPNQK
jgi:aspartyl-tRNA(Asn)/glutamyl-tRNA(Gln) amidotransferase subunit C